MHELARMRDMLAAEVGEDGFIGLVKDRHDTNKLMVLVIHPNDKKFVFCIFFGYVRILEKVSTFLFLTLTGVQAELGDEIINVIIVISVKINNDSITYP